MPKTEYHKKIVAYYDSTENSYKDSWDLDKSLAIHYGYWDKKVNSFPQSLARMNEVMMEAACIGSSDKVLDMGCGIGGSCIFLALAMGCQVTGITLSERQVQLARVYAKQKGVEQLVNFEVMNYGATSFPAESFDVIWGCESICYADNKQQFVKEVFRLLKPGGRFVMADGFVTKFIYNDYPVIRKWLDGWQVNYLESPNSFDSLLQLEGFNNIIFRDITKHVAHSSRRLLSFYFLATLQRWWKKIRFSDKSTAVQKKNIRACWYQYWGLKQNLWQYGLLVCKKP